VHLDPPQKSKGGKDGGGFAAKVQERRRRFDWKRWEMVDGNALGEGILGKKQKSKRNVRKVSSLFSRRDPLTTRLKRAEKGLPKEGSSRTEKRICWNEKGKGTGKGKKKNWGKGKGG